MNPKLSLLAKLANQLALMGLQMGTVALMGLQMGTVMPSFHTWVLEIQTQVLVLV